MLGLTRNGRHWFTFRPQPLDTCGIWPQNSGPSVPPVAMPRRSERVRQSGRLTGGLAGRDDPDDPLQVVERGELDHDLPLAAAQLHFDLGVQCVAQPVSPFADLRRGWGPAPWFAPCLRRRRTVADGPDLLDCPDGQSLGDDPVSQVLLS